LLSPAAGLAARIDQASFRAATMTRKLIVGSDIIDSERPFDKNSMWLNS